MVVQLKAGGIFFTSSTTLFLIAVSSGGIEFAWDSPGTLGLTPVAIYVCRAIQGLMIYSQLYYIPQFFILVKGFSPVDTGLALFPIMFTLVPGSIITGMLVTQTNNYCYPI
ncbi:hypothetical protein LZ31DRAFT_599788 [Colletotrichum somersetense]|nr:hypothetical protein LZ31DRAFT_599788 [Colletotrichum somersetense]